MPVTIAQALTLASRQIDRFDAELILAHLLKTERTWLAAHAHEPLTSTQQKRFKLHVEKRHAHEPIAYLVGETSFYAKRFFTDKRALIPRPETEDLVTRALESLSINPESWLAWDAGTGSGIIPITIRRLLPSLPVIASDVSREALSLARKNAKRHQITLPFYQANLLNDRLKRYIASSPHKALFITANLPYVPLKDKKTLMPDVRLYEPHLALFVPADGSGLIVRFLKQLNVYTKKDPRPWVGLFECDPSHVASLARTAQKLFPHARVSILPDMFKRKRFVEIRAITA